MDVRDRHAHGQDGTHQRHDDTEKRGSFEGPNYDISKKNIGLRHRQGRFESEELRSRNLDESSQAMSIPGTAGETAEGSFRWKRNTFEKPEGDFVKNCSVRIVKYTVFRGQGGLFEGCTFQMWRARGPQAKKTRR